MKALKKFMVVHRDPGMSWDKVEENWSKMAEIESATWLRTFYNVENNTRYCLWLAPGEDVLMKIFSGFKIAWRSILEVEETIPDIWARKYRDQMEAEEKEENVREL
ncbi:MAG: DUF4242 domain-containing protein [Deltaproteobacteria bacterium]|nr:DUF4242 domain-containing protein [Desulfatitalea sp.]MBI5843697.1 DUF4242 domain-containing protein [Deltaproteobacteria bacterium]